MKTNNRPLMYYPMLAQFVDGPGPVQPEMERQWWSFLEDLETATLFDARPLNLDFVADSGVTYIDELLADGERLVRLPHSPMYVEFDWPAGAFAGAGVETESGKLAMAGVTTGVIASEHDDDDGAGGIIEIEYVVHIRGASLLLRRAGPTLTASARYGYGFWWRNRDGGLMALTAKAFDEQQRRGFHTDPIPPPTVAGWKDEYERQFLSTMGEIRRTVQKQFFGILSLLDEKLLIDTEMVDAAPKLTKARAKKGLPPLDGPHHLLTLNVPAVRRVTLGLGGTHDSPALHWRRGHYRTVHPGEDRQFATWVRRCLVGDPAKGFVRADFRLKHSLPLIGVNGAR